MKKLFLVRHAKSDWEAKFKNDHDRPLSERGKRNAKALRKFLSERDFKADIAYISDSHRTIQTFKLVVRESWIIKKIIYTKKIYEATLEELISVIRFTNDRYTSVLIVGHNPGMETFSNYLLKHGNNSVFVKFATSGFAAFDCEIENWKALREGSGKLSLFLTQSKFNF